jgi:hypothetical protein
MVFEGLEARAALRSDGAGVRVTKRGEALFRAFGIDMAALASARRPMCRACLDWSVRRHHLAGALGAALLRRCGELGWARRESGSRIVRFTPSGEQALRSRFGVPAA